MKKLSSKNHRKSPLKAAKNIENSPNFFEDSQKIRGDLPQIDAIIPQKIPPEMRDVQRWLTWRYEWKDRAEKPTKVPYAPQAQHRKGSSTNPATWGTFDLAVALTTSKRGLGWVLKPPYIGIDLDDCIDKRGEITPFAQTILNRFPDTYAEWSPSGKGVHIIVKGVLKDAYHVSHLIEVYTAGRYFTVTGKALVDVPSRIATVTPEDLAWLEASTGKAKPHTPNTEHTISINETDTEDVPQRMLEKLFASGPQGARFKTTFERTRKLEGPEGDNSPSGYDAAVASEAVALGLDDQINFRLLNQSRRIAGHPIKPPEALKKTIAKAHVWNEARDKANLEKAKEEETLKTPETLSNEEKQAHASKILKMAIVQIIQRGKNPAMYEVQFADDEPALIDNVEEFATAKVWIHLAMSRKQAVVQLDKKRWLRTQRLLMSMIVYEDMPETQLKAQTENWLRTYVGRKSTRGNPGTAWIESGAPFVDKDGQYLTLAHFLVHVHVSCGARHVPLHALAGRLIQLGFREETVERADEKGSATRQYWVRHL